MPGKKRQAPEAASIIFSNSDRANQPFSSHNISAKGLRVFAAIKNMGLCFLGPAFILYAFALYKDRVPKTIFALSLLMPVPGGAILFANGYHSLICPVVLFLLILGDRLSRRSDSITTMGGAVLDRLDASIIIANRHGDILYSNGSTLNARLGVEKERRMSELIKRILTRCPPGERGGGILARAAGSPASHMVHGEITLDGGDDYAYHIHPLRKGKGIPAGQVYVFRDIAEYRRLIDKLRAKKRELAAAFTTLRKYAGIVHRLAQENERSRIIDQVNETAGCSLRQIVNTLKDNPDPARPAEIRTRLDRSIGTARDGIGRIRQSVSVLNELDGRGDALD